MKQTIVPHFTFIAKRYPLVLLLFVLLYVGSHAAPPCTFTLARLKYDGGGDWYANPSSLPNLVRAVKQRTAIYICDTVATVTLDDDRLFHHPFIYMTGHGEVRFSPRQQLRLRKYLLGGGFLWIDDNFGMDMSIRHELTKLFPESPLSPLSSSHPVFTNIYRLIALPKIHEHDGKPAEALAITVEKRMCILYTYSSDIGDGMENPDVHNDGPVLHELALKMGVNIVSWFFNP